jgi:chromosome segregation ATPase
MNLYTKLWLKLAPKGYVGVKESTADDWLKDNEEKERKIRKLEDHFKICETDKECYQERASNLEKKNGELRNTLDRLYSAYQVLVDAYEKMI